MTKAELIKALQWPLWAVAMYGMVAAFKRGRMKKQTGDQAHLMHLPLSVLVVGLVGSGFFVALAILSPIFPGVDNQGVALKEANPLIAIMFLGFACLGLPFIISYYREQHVIGENELRYCTMTKKGVLPWFDVKDVTYAPTAKWFRLITGDNKIIRVSILLAGLPEFAQIVLKKVPANKIEEETQKILAETAAGNPPSLWN